MDIYKLSDEIPDSLLTKKHKRDTIGDIASDDAGVSGGELTITDLKQGVKNPNRVNVFLNGKYVFSLGVTQVVDLKLKIGKEITPEELVEYKKASDFGKLYQRALEWVLTKPRSEKELKEYIARKLKMSNSEFSDDIIACFSKKGYLNDEKFAEWYVENRMVKKGISQKRLKMELKEKGISAEIIDEVLSKRNDEEEIMKIVAKKRNKYDDEKLIAYLCRQGFQYDLAKSVVNGG